MSRTFAVRVAKPEAIRLLGEAMRKKQADFVKDKQEYQKKIKEVDEKEAKEWVEFQKQIAKTKSLDAARDENSRVAWPQKYHRPAQPTLSLCDEKQLLTMLRSDTREVIPVPEGSLLWTLIQGRCEPIK